MTLALFDLAGKRALVTGSTQAIGLALAGGLAGVALGYVIAAALLADVAGDTLRQVFLAHLSRECNNLDLALHVVRTHLASAGLGHVRVLPTHPDKPSEFAEW